MRLYFIFLLFYQAVTEEEKAAFREALAPVLAECSAEHGVSDSDIKAAKEAGNPDGIKSCFLGCVLKKTEVVCIVDITISLFVLLVFCWNTLHK